ncbi:protein BatD [Aestuariicella hydrocarbonica]|uniref:Protein BatD n=1 Tax=Pseudomaricurvus hydrocarbonicus TaxID=1470433 RepID=A0A9E5JXT6_9GAMM|nr:BatD family protein [Aestuariicella hydrocarbonica]NHO66525.1 protein BatD [Aestuariicella hydrocarbonica]
MFRLGNRSRLGAVLLVCGVSALLVAVAPVRAQTVPSWSSQQAGNSQQTVSPQRQSALQEPQQTPQAQRSTAPKVLIRTQLLDRHGQLINPVGIEGVASKKKTPARDSLPVVGERVTLVIEVLTPTWFTQSPRFEHLTMADAIAVTKSHFVNNISERIDGITYAGLRREFAIFPKRAGQFVIPALKVATKTMDEHQQSTSLQLRSKPMLLLVENLPVGPAEGSAAPVSLVAESVRMEQRFTASLDSLQVGDVVQRQIVVWAESTLGMLIPLLTWPEVDGVKQQSLNATVDDDNARGAFTGSRRETRMYTLQQAGEVTLPAISLPWWDGRAWQLATAPASTVTVSAATAGGADGVPDNRVLAAGKSSSATKYFGGLLALLLIALMLLALGYVRFQRSRSSARGHTAADPDNLLLRWWRQRCQSEPAHYRRLRRAIRRGHHDDIVRCYYGWQKKLPLAVVARHRPPDFETHWAEVYRRAAAQEPLTAQQQAALLSGVSAMHRACHRHGVEKNHDSGKPGEAALRSSDPESLCRLKELVTLNPR